MATTSAVAVALMGKIAEPLVVSFAREDGEGGVAEAGGALRREVVREFVGGKQGEQEGVDGEPAVGLEPSVSLCVRG